MNATIITADRQVSCPICYEKFPDSDDDEYRSHLLRHLESYDGESICHECRTDCNTPDKMIDHFMFVHGGVDKLVCPDPNCIRSFRTKRTLLMHAKKHNKAGYTAIQSRTVGQEQ